MNRVTWGAAGGTALSAVLSMRLWSRGMKDIGLVFGSASIVFGYFCVSDWLRSRDPEHKKQLYEKRKAAWAESNIRPIVGILKQQAQRMGGMAVLKNPQVGQQLMMQFIQAGEQCLQRQDLVGATKYFTYGVDISYFTQSEEAAMKLVATIGSMIPQITGTIKADFEKDKKAIDAMVRESAPKPLKSRDEMIQSLKDDLEVDPIDESDAEEEKKPIIEEVIEETDEKEKELEEDPIDEEEEKPVQSTPSPAPEEVTSAEEITSAEVLQATDEEKPVEQEEVKNVETTPEVKDVVAENTQEITDEPVENNEETPQQPEDEGDAPTIVKTSVMATPTTTTSANEANEMEDEELE